jgi:hypothetical protein
MQVRQSWLMIVAIVIVLSASAPGSAAGFATIDSGGQNREHERITRAALSKAFQIRPMLERDSPLRSAIFARDQCVAFAGVDSRVATTTSSTCSAVIDDGRPGRGSSASPSRRARRTGPATCPPSAPRPRAHRRPRCSTGPRRTPARSLIAAPPPAPRCTAAPTAAAARARHWSVPARLSGVRCGPCTILRLKLRNTGARH